MIGAIMVKGFASMAALGGPDRLRASEEKLKPVTDVLNRHGMDEETLKSMKPQGPMIPGQTNPERLEELLAPVKERNRFVADMMAVMRTESNREDFRPFESDARLEDLTVTDDTATAIIVQTKKGTQKRDRIDFERRNGSWKIALPDLGR